MQYKTQHNGHHIFRRQTYEKFNFQIIVACLAAVALAAPKPDYPSSADQRSFSDSAEHIHILRDDRQMSDDGSSYNFAVETEDGIVREEFGSAITGGSAEGAVAQSGTIS